MVSVLRWRRDEYSDGNSDEHTDWRGYEYSNENSNKNSNGHTNVVPGVLYRSDDGPFWLYRA